MGKRRQKGERVFANLAVGEQRVLSGNRIPVAQKATGVVPGSGCVDRH
ncbi:MAG: hypothetical protein WBG38_18475 [Nodosilinea sp.]